MIAFMIRFYQAGSFYLRPLFGFTFPCRHLPSCSQYALRAVEDHGAWEGAWLGLKRLLSCHPWGKHQRRI